MRLGGARVRGGGAGSARRLIMRQDARGHCHYAVEPHEGGCRESRRRFEDCGMRWKQPELLWKPHLAWAIGGD